MRRYIDFTEEMVDLVLANDGSLKAEHGTGRVMAPFVRRQYGDELYEVMVEIKRLFDPSGLLNTGTIITDDPELHLKHIKVNPTVEPEVDRCTSCGYCEPVCPSRDLTLTPRQRIAVGRELASLELSGDTAADQTDREGLRLPGGAHLRGGRHVRAGVPGEHQHRAAREEAPTYDRPEADRCGLDDPGEALEGHDRDVLHGDEHHRRAARPARGRPRRGRQGGARDAGQGLDPALVDRAARWRATTSPPTAHRRGGGGVPAGLRERDVRAHRGRRGAARLRGSVRPGRAEPAGARGDREPVLRHTLVEQGHPEGVRRDARPGPARDPEGERQRAPHRGLRRLELYRGVPPHDRDRPGAVRRGHGLRDVRGTQRAARPRRLPQARLAHGAPDLLVHPDGPQPRSHDRGEGRGRDRARTPGHRVLRLRGRPGHAASGADGIGHPTRGGRGRRAGFDGARELQPYVRARPDQSHRAPRTDTSSSCSPSSSRSPAPGRRVVPTRRQVPARCRVGAYAKGDTSWPATARSTS